MVGRLGSRSLVFGVAVLVASAVASTGSASLAAPVAAPPRFPPPSSVAGPLSCYNGNPRAYAQAQRQVAQFQGRVRRAYGEAQRRSLRGGPPDILYVTNYFGNSITEYPVGASGDVAPIRTIAGPTTQLNGPGDLALDAAGDLWVANSSANDILEFAPGANGDVAPIAVLGGPATQLGGVPKIFFDAAGDLWTTADYPNDQYNYILKFAPGATGNVAPIAKIVGPHTGINYPTSITLDPAGHIFVTNYLGGSVTEYCPGANGDVAPIATISGVSHASDVNYGPGGLLYVNTKPPPELPNAATGAGGAGVAEYVPGSNGNVVPVAMLTGPATMFDNPITTSFDALGHIFVSNFFSNTITEFPPGAHGNVAPIAVIAGPNTGLNGPAGTVVSGSPYHKSYNG